MAGDSPTGNDGKALGGPGVNLVYGMQTEIIVCSATGDLPARLEVKDGGQWRTVANGFRSSSDPTRCASSSRPIAFSFYWIVDVRGTVQYRKSGAERRQREIEIRISTSTDTWLYVRNVGLTKDDYLWDLADALRCGFGETAYC